MEMQGCNACREARRPALSPAFLRPSWLRLPEGNPVRVVRSAQSRCSHCVHYHWWLWTQCAIWCALGGLCLQFRLTPLTLLQTPAILPLPKAQGKDRLGGISNHKHAPAYRPALRQGEAGCCCAPRRIPQPVVNRHRRLPLSATIEIR